MSDNNIIQFPDTAPKPGASSGTERPEGSPQYGGGAGGGGSQPPGMDARVSALEADMKEVRAGVQRLEVATGRVEATLAAMDARIGRVETNVGTALTTAVGKAIGPVQFITMVGGAATVIAAVAGFYAWASHQVWFPH